jgi:tetratricopeptide (TPR) repeat protein
VTVLVADFTNHTGDPIFDGTLEPMFNVALEGASFVNAFNRGTARKLAAKIPGAGERLDERTARLIAVSQGVSAVLIGSLARSGNDYRISVDAVDAVTGKTIAHREVSASTKDSVLMAIPKLAAPIRNALGDTTPESEQLAATQGSFATSNLEAVHQFGMGMEQQFAGNMEAALKSFSNAAELDPNFARAYAGMAAVAGNLGQRQNAEKYAKLAMEHVDRMTERERYRIRGLYYIRTGNWQKCVEEYSELTKQYPSDNIGQNNLASCYARLENMPKAMEEARRAVDIAPKDVMARMNFALYACYAGDFPTCGRDGHEVLQLNPSFEQAFLVIAYAQLGQGQLREATETYKKLQEVSAHGASLAASGLANIALYEGKYREAIRILEKGVAADLAATNRDAAADKFSMLAYAKISVGEKPAAVAAGRSALRESQTAKTQFLVARTFVEAGEIQQARKLATSLASEVQGPPQTYAKIILGEAALKDHKFSEAIRLFGEANKLINTWIGHFDLGRAYLEANAFAEADSEFDECIKRRGEALELFMDDMPTYSYFPPVYYYQGRVREGLKSPGFRDSYRMYLNIRGSAAEDSLLAEINHRLAR